MGSWVTCGSWVLGRTNEVPEVCLEEIKDLGDLLKQNYLFYEALPKGAGPTPLLMGIFFPRILLSRKVAMNGPLIKPNGVTNSN